MVRVWTPEQKAAASARAKARIAAVGKIVGESNQQVLLAKSMAEPAPAPTIEGGAVDLAAVMAMVQKLQDDQAALKEENAQLHLKLGGLEAAQKQLVDEFGQTVDVAPPNDLSATIERLQRPKGNIEEILNDAEMQARERGDKTFSRDRLRRALNGEQVEDVNRFVCPNCGKLKPHWKSDADVENHIATDCKKKH